MQKHSMTQEEQIGQVVAVGLQGTTVSPEVIDLIQNYHAGSIILFSRNIRDVEQVRKLTRQLQMIAKAAGHRYPLLICVDQENGMVRRFGDKITIFPGNMTLGAIGSEQMAYDVALATGQELKALGINMNLAPDVDVNNNPANPVIGVRSFGEDAHQVGCLAAAMVKGYRAAGIITNIKHFPGHGDTAIDSHLDLPTIPYDMERLEAVELVPFKSAIAAGADSVMIAHLYLPHLMAQKGLPSTISPAIVKGLLREKLGFTGLIVTDCLEMKAFADTIGVERGAVMALQAGNDLILISHVYSRQVNSFKAIRAAVEVGTLSAETIQQAAERVVSLKERFLSWEQMPDEEVSVWIGNKEHQELQKRAYELSTTLVRDNQGLLPLRLKPAQQILLISAEPAHYSGAADRFKLDTTLLEGLRLRHANVSAINLVAEYAEPLKQELELAARAVDIIIMVTVNANLHPQQQEVMHSLLQTGKPVIGIAVFNPYDLLVFPELGTYLVTYEITPPAMTAAVKVIFGEIEAQGRLPVGLPGLYPLAG